jgi:integrase
MHPVRMPRTPPVVFSPDEVRRLIEAAGNLKHQTALSGEYGAGLRASEVVALKVTDIDSERMTLRVEQGRYRATLNELSLLTSDPVRPQIAVYKRRRPDTQTAALISERSLHPQRRVQCCNIGLLPRLALSG